MKHKKSTNNGGLTGVEAAPRRAALRAREIAAQTGTPLVIYKNGKIVKLMILRVNFLQNDLHRLWGLFGDPATILSIAE